MIITEEEAKEKLCQEAIGPGAPDWVFVPHLRRCIGSGCMAWRWSDDTTFENGKMRRDHRRGYCGKAGRP